MNTYFRRYFDAAPEGGAGGAAPKFTLGDLNAGDEKIKTDSGAQTPQDIAAAAETQRLADEAAAKTLADQEAAKTEGLNEDGTVKEGYIKADDGTVSKDPNYTAPTGDDTSVEDEAFYESVDKLRGEKVEVTYPDGLDPMSPEGVYHREKVVEKNAVDRFEEYLRETDARGYAYLLHRQAGGSDEDFFAKKTFSLPDYETFKANADVQTRIYKASLISKGLDDESAQLLVDKAIKDNKLLAVADAAYQSTLAQQTKDLEDIEKTNAAAETAYKTSVAALNQQLAGAVVEGRGMNIIIPDTEKTPFLTFVRSVVQYDRPTGKFLITQPIEADKLSRQLDALYLQYKNGDLKSLIQREAQTANRKRLGAQVDKSKAQATGGAADDKSKAGFVALGSL